MSAQMMNAISTTYVSARTQGLRHTISIAVIWLSGLSVSTVSEFTPGRGAGPIRPGRRPSAARPAQQVEARLVPAVEHPHQLRLPPLRLCRERPLEQAQLVGDDEHAGVWRGDPGGLGEKPGVERRVHLVVAYGVAPGQVAGEPVEAGVGEGQLGGVLVQQFDCAGESRLLQVGAGTL